jgi:separase
MTDGIRSTARYKATSSTRTVSKLKSTVLSPDELADQLASGLHVSSANKASTSSVEKCRLAAMRSVNTASQNLSAVVQSGWKLKTGSTGKMATTSRSVNTSVASISKSLRDLRDISPGGVDVERAAVSVVGKLIALEMVSGSFSLEFLS